MPVRFSEEGGFLPLPDDVLKKYGFKNILKPCDRGKEEYGYDAGYTHRLRIHDIMYLMYDKNGFMTMMQLSERGSTGEAKLGARGYRNDSYITIPKPVREEETLKQLLNAILI
jgi:hypothetical protein